MNPKSKQQLRERIHSIIAAAQRNENSSLGNLTLDEAEEKAMQAFESFHTGEVERARLEGQVKELEAANILPDFAFDAGCEWFIQGVKVPKYIARKISNAAKERRTELMKHLQSIESDKS